jgi:hypothetical protein
VHVRVASGSRLGGGSFGGEERHRYVSTRSEDQTRGLGGGRLLAERDGSGSDPAEDVALVARAKRDVLLRVYRHQFYRSGVRRISEIVRDNPLAQDYVNWGAPGPGRWVTIYATASPTPHVFIVIADLRLDTSHGGTDVGPNQNEDGPRWRILDHIPTWAHWSVRHPPGL